MLNHRPTQSRIAIERKVVRVIDRETSFPEANDSIARGLADLALFLVAASGVPVIAEAVVLHDKARIRQDDVGGVADEDVGVDMDAVSEQAAHDVPLVVRCGRAHDLAVEVRLGAQPTLGIGVETEEMSSHARESTERLDRGSGGPSPEPVAAVICRPGERRRISYGARPPRSPFSRFKTFRDAAAPTSSWCRRATGWSA